MFVVLVTFETIEAHIADFLTAVRKQASDSLENEENCLRFDVCVGNNAPAAIVLYEIYTDSAAFDLHLRTPHFKNFDKNTKHMFADKRVTTLTLQEGGAP